MYADDEDDWKILKEYKVSYRNKISKERDEVIKKGKRCENGRVRAEVELKELEAKQAKPTRSRTSNVGYQITKKKQFIDDLNYDIATAADLEKKYTLELEQLKADIDAIDEKLKSIRRNNEAKKKLASKTEAEPVQPCPKKCRISDVKIACSHGGRTMAIEPVNPEDGSTPEFHVLATTNLKTPEIITVNFAGSCDHGKSQSAGDSANYKLFSRADNASDYCPRVSIYGNDKDNTHIERPSKTQFLAKPDTSYGNKTPLGFLFNRLIFGSDDYDTYSYDLHFHACKGSLPYKAKVVAHPTCSWSLEFTCGYKENYTHHTLEVAELDNYDGVKTKGAWESKIKASYSYDIHTETLEQELKLDALFKDIGELPFISSLADFFKPLGGFLEGAASYSKAGEAEYDKTLKASKSSGLFLAEYKTSVFEVQWPKLKLSGNYKRSERKGESFGIGGEGKLAIEFAPLLGLTGKIDLIQYLLMTLGTGFGPFLRKISKMSMGHKKPDGSLDKTKSYVETNLELWLGITSTINGVAAFKIAEGKWDGKAGSSVSGFIGFIFEGKAKVDGKIWKITFGAGAEFKTTDESGSKQSGIEVSLKPIAIKNELAFAGLTEFTGLAITWALYANLGAEGEVIEEDNKGKNVKKGKFGKSSIKQEAKESGKHVLLKKRTWLGGQSPSKLGS